MNGYLQCALWLWRDLYHWTRLCGSLPGQTLAMGLTGHVWTVGEYLRHAFHVSSYQLEEWAVRRNNALDSALEAGKRKRISPTT